MILAVLLALPFLHQVIRINNHWRKASDCRNKEEGRIKNKQTAANAFQTLKICHAIREHYQSASSVTNFQEIISPAIGEQVTVKFSALPPSRQVTLTQKKSTTAVSKHFVHYISFSAFLGD